MYGVDKPIEVKGFAGIEITHILLTVGANVDAVGVTVGLKEGRRVGLRDDILYQEKRCKECEAKEAFKC